MSKSTKEDPTNSTFATRAAARAGAEAKPGRRLALRAGLDAEHDFEIAHDRDRSDSVHQITL